MDQAQCRDHEASLQSGLDVGCKRGPSSKKLRKLSAMRRRGTYRGSPHEIKYGNVGRYLYLLIKIRNRGPELPFASPKI